MKVPSRHVMVARVVGENEEGMTLFVPKSMKGKFHLEGGEQFLTFIFVHQVNGQGETWIPWEHPTE